MTEIASSSTATHVVSASIKSLDSGSIHKISSGQVVVDLQTAVKELVENSLDAGATNIEIRFKEYGLESFEVIDNGCGIPPEDYEYIGLKHHTSKLSSYTDLETVATFGFRGEALSSLCALADSVSVTTATASEAPVGTVIEFEKTGKIKSKKAKAARQRGTTVIVSGLFKPLPVRRKELERNAKREYGKALTLLHAYALVPCAKENKGVRLSVTNQTAGGKKSVQLRTDGTPSTRASVSGIWGPKALEHLVELDLKFSVDVEAAVLRRLGRTQDDESSNAIRVRGLISKFAVGCGRNGTDRQFFFINGRPCAPSKVQKAFNEVYRTFNATQSPFVIADFIVPTNSCDVNVSPDKRTILLHSENNLVQALKAALEETYAPSRSTFDVNASQALRRADPSPTSTQAQRTQVGEKVPLFLPDEAAGEESSPAASRSQPSSQLPLDDNGGASSSAPGVADDWEQSESFGEPVLLSGSEPSSAAFPSQDSGQGGPDKDSDRPPLGETLDMEVDLVEAGLVEADLVGAGFDDEPGQVQSQERTTATSGRGAPVSSTVTPMARERPEEPLSVQMDVDEVEDATRDNDDPPPRRLAARQKAALERATSVDDVPIPSIRSPVRPVIRASVQLQSQSGGSSKSAGKQTVLSTSGASWNLRRKVDGHSEDAERPRKKGKFDSAREGRDAQADMRVMLKGFARKGSRVDEVHMDVAEGQDEEEDGADGEEDDTRDASSRGINDEQESSEVGLQKPPDTDQSADTINTDKVMGSVNSEPDVIETTVDDDVDMLERAATAEHIHGDTGSSSVTTTCDEVVQTGDRESVSLSFDLSRIASSWKSLQTCLVGALRDRDVLEGDQARNSITLCSAAGVGNTTDDEEAAEALSRVIEKTDFATMEVVGQFNLGFIVVRRRKSGTLEDSVGGPEMDDLFIVDQHAADEKYNFETLQRTTKIDSQKLFRPQVLELTAADELVALENIEVLRQNGFELDVAEDCPAGQRIQLTAQPISKSTVFDMKDLEELLHLMQDRPTGQMVRCSKARAMFASRACRKSVMIGTPLNRRQMTSVVQHMGTIDQPWHCPHGRPTMRHLSDIVGAGWDRRSEPTRGVDWAAFGRVAAASDV